jgi:CRP-like cAMP-binding protein
MTTGLQSLLAKHPFFEDMNQEYLDFMAGCAANARFAADEYLAREGSSANYFFILREGQVSHELQGGGRGPVTLLTSGPGDLVGYSWLMPPHRWVFDLRALTVVRALMFDGECLRKKCDEDQRLGYDLMRRVARHMIRQFNAVLLRLPDVYGEPAER